MAKADRLIPWLGGEVGDKAEKLRKRREKQQKELDKIMKETNPGAYKKQKK